MQHEAKQVSFELPAKYSGSWPPDVQRLAGLGFDSISSGGHSVAVRKALGHDWSGNQHGFVQIELRKNSVALSYAGQPKSDPEILRLRVSLLALRVLSQVRGYSASLPEVSLLLLPALESAEKISREPYDSLSKKYSDLLADFSESSAKAKRASAGAESGARAVLELEKRASALQERIRKLETVSDSVLRELLLEWLLAHRGSFSMAAFCRQAGVQPPRCEEGLEALLKEGAIKKVDTGYLSEKTGAPQEFRVRKSGVALLLEKFLPLQKSL